MMSNCLHVHMTLPQSVNIKGIQIDQAILSLDMFTTRHSSVDYCHLKKLVLQLQPLQNQEYHSNENLLQYRGNENLLQYRSNENLLQYTLLVSTCTHHGNNRSNLRYIMHYT